jgi:hypothetical protein
MAPKKAKSKAKADPAAATGADGASAPEVKQYQLTADQLSAFKEAFAIFDKNNQVVITILFILLFRVFFRFLILVLCIVLLVKIQQMLN